MKSIRDVVVQKMSESMDEMIRDEASGGNRLRLVFYAPTRGLIGYLANCSPTRAARPS